MQKKANKTVNKKDIYGKANYDGQIVTLVKIAVGVIIVLGIVYLGTALATGEIKLGNKGTEKKEEVTIQYEEIVAGQILNRKSKEYYVLACNFTDEEASYYLSLKDSYNKNTDAIPFYLVDLEKGFNQVLIPEKDEKYVQKPATIQDLKVKAPSILKIKDGKVIERIETSDKVKEYLEKIA